MTTENSPYPSDESVVTSSDSGAPATEPARTVTGMPEKPGTPKADRIDQIANRMAHKGAKHEQAFDTENSKPFSK